MLSFRRHLRRLVPVLLGRDFFFRPNHACRTQRFGSAYGGWDVAVDGIDADSIVYSCGVGEDASFDLALIETFGLHVHAFDPTPGAIEWVGRQGLPDNFVLHEYGIADVNGSLDFHPPRDPRHVSYSVVDRPGAMAGSITLPVKRLTTIMVELGHDHIDLLKLDIEGAEYGVLADMEKCGTRPGQVLVEFHHRFRGVGIGQTKEAIARLARMGYRRFSVSASGEEFGLVSVAN